MKKKQRYTCMALMVIFLCLPSAVLAEDPSGQMRNSSTVTKNAEKEKARLELERKRYEDRIREDAMARRLRALEDQDKEKAATFKSAPATTPAPVVVVVTPPPVRASSYTDSITGMEFVYVKGGCYQMGDTFGGGYPEEKPHEVCVGDFWLGKYEVTQSEWEKLMSANQSSSKKGPRYPVENVSWDDAQVFIKKRNSQSGLNYRLPTEAEWEFAARSGGNKENWAGTSDDSSFTEYAWHDKNSGNTTHEVGTRKPNGLGLYDMSGNVFEWCGDWYDENYYNSSPRDNPAGPQIGSMRAIRGGSWNIYRRNVRASYRYRGSSNFRRNDLGFRLALTPSPGGGTP